MAWLEVGARGMAWLEVAERAPEKRCSFGAPCIGRIPLYRPCVASKKLYVGVCAVGVVTAFHFS